MSIGTVTTTADAIDSKTPTALRVVFNKPAGNKTSLALTAINEWDYISREMFEQNIPVVGDVRLPVIPAGTSMPKNYTSVDIPTLNIASRFLVEYETSATTTEPTSDQRVVKNYTDGTKTAIASIDVYGNNNGTGGFNENTWLCC